MWWNEAEIKRLYGSRRVEDLVPILGAPSKDALIGKARRMGLHGRYVKKRPNHVAPITPEERFARLFRPKKNAAPL